MDLNKITSLHYNDVLNGKITINLNTIKDLNRNLLAQESFIQLVIQYWGEANKFNEIFVQLEIGVASIIIERLLEKLSDTQLQQYPLETWIQQLEETIHKSYSSFDKNVVKNYIQHITNLALNYNDNFDDLFDDDESLLDYLDLNPVDNSFLSNDDLLDLVDNNQLFQKSIQQKNHAQTEKEHSLKITDVLISNKTQSNNYKNQSDNQDKSDNKIQPSPKDNFLDEITADSGLIFSKLNRKIKPGEAEKNITRLSRIILNQPDEVNEATWEYLKKPKFFFSFCVGFASNFLMYEINDKNNPMFKQNFILFCQRLLERTQLSYIALLLHSIIQNIQDKNINYFSSNKNTYLNLLKPPLKNKELQNMLYRFAIGDFIDPHELQQIHHLNLLDPVLSVFPSSEFSVQSNANLPKHQAQPSSVWSKEIHQSPIKNKYASMIKNEKQTNKKDYSTDPSNLERWTRYQQEYLYTSKNNRFDSPYRDIVEKYLRDNMWSPIFDNNLNNNGLIKQMVFSLFFLNPLPLFFKNPTKTEIFLEQLSLLGVFFKKLTIDKREVFLEFFKTQLLKSKLDELYLIPENVNKIHTLFTKMVSRFIQNIEDEDESTLLTNVLNEIANGK